jgi:site-specific DNA-methyltransferase (adenine-specific)
VAELIWRGKYDAAGQRVQPERISLPLRTIETIGRGGGSWLNRLIEGDRLPVLSALLKDFAGQVDLIYLDPPFATGGQFVMGAASGLKMQPAYCDTWADEDQYLQWLYETLALARDLLKDSGSIYVHLAHHMGQYGRVLLDEVFGRECFQNEIIWSYRTGGASQRRFARKHDNIFFYTKSLSDWTFNPRKERSYMMHRYGYRKSDFQIDSQTGQQFSLVFPRDVWEIPSVGSVTAERVGYPTQKPEHLLERIIRSSSNEGDVVLDCFAGSGTTAVVAEKLGRRWITSDASPVAIKTTRNRLVRHNAAFTLQAVGSLVEEDSDGRTG